MDVLVIITDMTNYCDALREISTGARGTARTARLPRLHVFGPGVALRAGGPHPGAGRVRHDAAGGHHARRRHHHPIPDLTGYITEGQIVLSRELHQKGVFPPIDVLPSLSRLMQKGIGEGRTRKDHRNTANHLYKYYAKGRDLRRLESIVGRDGMTKPTH